LSIDALIESLPPLLEGLKITVGLTIFSLLLGSVLGILLAVGRVYGMKPLSSLIYIYEKIFRGIPLLVIFFFIYFGLSQIGLNLDPFTAAVFGLGLRSTAYQSQIYRSAFNSIPEGQMIAARSIGMTKLKSIRYIILPQVLRLSIPGWSNELTIVLKDTSIAFSIGVIDLMRQGRYIYSVNHELVLQVLLLIAVIYFIMVFSINQVLNYLEKKYEMSGFKLEIER